MPRPQLLTVAIILCELAHIRCSVFGEPAATRTALILGSLSMIAWGIKLRLDRIESRLDALARAPITSPSLPLRDPSRN
jgi:hypothetical protein